MSVANNTTNSPTVLCLGSESGLMDKIAADFSSIGCRVSRYSIVEASGQVKTSESLPNYVCIFAPEIPAEDEEVSHAEFAEIDSLLNYFANKPTKTLYISRHPDEYRGVKPSSFKVEERAENHSEKLSARINQARQKSMRVSVLLVKDLVLGENEDSPFAISKVFDDVPENLNLPWPESHLLHPVSAQQISDGVKKILFSSAGSGSVFTVVGKKGTTAINFVLKAKNSYENQTGQQITIKSSHKIFAKKNYHERAIHPREVFNLESVIAQRIHNSLSRMKPSPTSKTKNITRETQLEGGSTPKRKVVQKKKTKALKIKKKKSNKRIKKPNIKWAGLLILSAWMIVQFAYAASLRGSILAMGEGNALGALQKSIVAKHTHSIGKISILPMTILSQKTISKDAFEVSSETTQIVSTYLEMIEDIASISQLGDEVFEGILGAEKVDVFKKIEQLLPKIQNTYQAISTLEIKIKNVQAANKSQFVSSIATQSLEKIKQAKIILNSAQKTLSISEEILGKDAKKTYVVLLQNNTELRATGGFIGSFALVSFEKGKMYDIETYDVYSADGQLRGHVEPPAEIKQYLGEANWYLRDSNYNPNFPTTARRVEWFLNKEIARQVDGVVGINLYVVKDLLKAVGGVEVSDYQETITDQNLFQRAQYKSELNYFEGSTQKKDFISSLISALYLKIIDGQAEHKKQLMTAIIKNAQSSQIQVSLRNPAVDSLMQDTIFSGKTVEARCRVSTDQGCINDYVGVIESNFGVNKVNYFIQRSMSHMINIDSEKITHQVQLDIENTAETAAWPAGDYKNYVRFYIPRNAILKKAEIDGQSVPIKSIRITQENGKKSIGFLVLVPISDQKSIQIQYQMPHQATKAGEYIYQLYLEKQSGTGDDPISVQVSNSQASPKVVSGGESPDQSRGSSAKPGENQVIFNTTAQKDQFLIVNY